MRTGIFVLLAVWIAFLAGCGRSASQPTGDPASGTNPTPASAPAATPVPAPVPQAETVPEPEIVVDHRPLEWRFAYGPDGEPVGVTSPSGIEIRWERRLSPAGWVQEVVKRLPDESVSYELDAEGRVVAMIDHTGRTEYRYDAQGLPNEVRRPDGERISYETNSLGQITGVRLGDHATGYAYDDLGRLQAIELPQGGGKITYEYPEAEDQVIRTLPNGIRSIRRYGPDGRLASIEHTCGRNGDRLLRFEYAYRADGLVREIRESSSQGEKLLTYQYDAESRLAAVHDSELGTTEYRYDDFGNRTAVVRDGRESSRAVFDWACRMVAYEGQACEHDANGNLTRLGSGADETQFVYSVEDQLTAVRTATGETRFTYDGDGHLIARRDDQGETRFVPDPLADTWKPLLRRDADGAETMYVWGEGGVPIAEVRGGEVRFFLFDHLGSPRAYVDSQGRLTGEQSYSPFGTPTGCQTGLRPGLAGMFFDPTGLYLTRRAYAASLGRFLQRDPEHRIPSGLQADLNAYAYCGSQPISQVDVSGLFPGPPPFMPPSDFQQIQRTMVAAGMGSTGFRAPAQRNEHAITLGSVGRALIEGICDPLGAQQFYAERSARAMSAGTVGGVFRSIGYDLLGGVVYGPGVNREQRLAGTAWSLVPGVGVARSGTSMIWKASQGDARGALGASAGLVLPGLKMRADHHKLTQLARGIERVDQGAGLIASGRAVYQEYFGRGRDEAPASLSPVGGVYLGGAADALRHLGRLRGISVDPQGRLVLLTEQESELALPPLELDDLVTVFRAVYEEGAPSVSIDPIAPGAPEMTIRHGNGQSLTAGTRVGWILFEADRLMKAHSIGRDNLTGKDVQSGIPGYQAILDLGFAESTRKSNWERFWIVCDRVDRCRIDGGLTLFNVPLRVNTEAMVLQGGKLVPASNPLASRHAREFSRWFTEHLDAVDEEVVPIIPAGNSVGHGIRIFAELRRIALMTAIAETLRDQGVPLPSWMRQHRIRPFAMPTTTPAITVQRTKSVRNGTAIYQVYGGVNMGIWSGDGVFDHEPTAWRRRLAAALDTAIQPATDLKPVSFSAEGRQYTAVAFPADETRAVGACRTSEVDLAVPCADGSEDLTLVRHFNSLHNPSDVFGEVWTLDLPSLVKDLIPVERRADGVTCRVEFHLASPLGSVSGQVQVFESRVPALATDSYAVPHDNGTRLHFHRQSGCLLAAQHSDGWIVYRRNAGGRIESMEKWNHEQRVAGLQLRYDARGRITTAVGSHGRSVQYDYDGDGLLRSVTNDGVPHRAYAYRDGLLSSIRDADGDEVRYRYNPRGQLERAESANRSLAWSYGEDPATVTSVCLTEKSDEGTVSQVTIDAAGMLAFRYGEQHLEFREGQYVKVRGLDGRTWEIQAQDGTREQRQLRTPGGLQFAFVSDAANRLVHVHARQATWHYDTDQQGRLTAIRLTAAP